MKNNQNHSEMIRLREKESKHAGIDVYPGFGNYSGAFGPHDKFGQSRPWRDYEDLPFYHDFCLAAKIGCDEAVIKVLPLIGRNAFFLCFGGIAGSFCLMALVGWLHREAFTRLLSEGERRQNS